MLWRWVDDSTAEYYMLGYKKRNRVVFPIKTYTEDTSDLLPEA